MALNKNVGIGGLDQGLCLIPTATPGLFEIPENEAGLQQATIRFATFDPKRFKPARATPLPSFQAGNEETRALLALFPYLACQTSKILWNSEGVGVHGLEVVAQGAVFNAAISASAVIAVAIASRGRYLVAPSVVFFGGDQVSPAHATATLQARTTIDIFATGTGYSVGDVLTLVGGSFVRPVKLHVDQVVGGAIQALGFHIVDKGSYYSIPSTPVAVTGGTGSGALFTFDNFELGIIQIVDGGYSSGTPQASLVGDFVQLGHLGVVSMGSQTLGSGGGLTVPFDPVTTVKDTVEVPVQTATVTVGGGGGPAPAPLRARVCTITLPAYRASQVQGQQTTVTQLEAQDAGPLPPLDGVTLNVGDVVLVNDGSQWAGCYAVTDIGRGDNPPFYGPLQWKLRQAFFTGSGQIAVAEGSANSGLWQSHYAPTGGGLPPAHYYFTLVSGSAGSPPPVTYHVGLKVTIEYRAIELTFEYVAAQFASDPRFIHNEYQLDASGQIVVSPATGRKMVLRIDSFSAVEQIADANGSISDGNTIAIDEATWRAAVKYIGTAAQFEQTPAGIYWNVRETVTIKIVPILAGLVAPVIPQSS